MSACGDAGGGLELQNRSGSNHPCVPGRPRRCSIQHVSGAWMNDVLQRRIEIPAFAEFQKVSERDQGFVIARRPRADAKRLIVEIECSRPAGYMRIRKAQADLVGRT